jgi:hypothetical protein
MCYQFSSVLLVRVGIFFLVIVLQFWHQDEVLVDLFLQSQFALQEKNM